MAASLQDLPVNVIQNITQLLPQQDKLNLLYTNYHFYCAVQPVIYKRLLFVRGYDVTTKNRYYKGSYTVIGYSKNPLATELLNEKILETRQEILLDSLKTNPELCKYVEEVVIREDSNDMSFFQNPSGVVILELASFIEENCPHLKSYRSHHSDKTEIQNRLYKPNFAFVDVTSLQQLNWVSDNAKMLIFNGFENGLGAGNLEEKRLVKVLSQIDTFIFNDHEAQAEVLMTYTKSLQSAVGEQLKNHRVSTAKFLYSHIREESQVFLKVFLENIDISFLRNLELVFECDDVTCSCVPALLEFLLEKDLCLTRLSFYHKSNQRDHNIYEVSDFIITEFLKKLKNRDQLKYLAVRHDTPPDFSIENGLEGNYIHRRTLYENTLPLLTGLETIVCPSFMQSVACYEQLVSNFLWNGCTCVHCSDYLPIFDQYILDHEYYNELKARIVRMISPVLFGNIGRALSNRHVSDVDLFLDDCPLINRVWDFHTSESRISEINKSKDLCCPINQSAFIPASKCAAHFLKDYVEALNRMIPSLKCCILSGVYFEKVNGINSRNWICSDSD